MKTRQEYKTCRDENQSFLSLVLIRNPDTFCRHQLNITAEVERGSGFCVENKSFVTGEVSIIRTEEF